MLGRLTLRAGVALLLGTAAACSSPTLPSCYFDLVLNPENVAPAGAQGTAVVSPSPGTPSCSWAIRTDNASWLSLSGAQSGTRQTSLGFTASANTSTQPRTAQVSLEWSDDNGGGLIHRTLTQGGQVIPAPSINPPSNGVGFGGGTFSIGVSSPGAWTASVTQGGAFITITAGASGNGDGTLTYTVSANGGGARQGTIVVTGAGGTASHSISQAAVSNSLSVNPAFVTVPAAGQSGLTTQVSANVSWTATVDPAAAAWLSITSGASGSNNGTITFAVAANTGAASRTGTITVSGGGASAVLNVGQNGTASSLSINPTSSPVIGAGGQSGLTTQVTSNVSWTATVSAGAASWLSITGGASGSNNGTITYSVAANSGAARVGTITVSGGGLTATLTVSQATGVLNASFEVEQAPCDITPNAGKNRIFNCTFNASGSTGVIQTYEFRGTLGGIEFLMGQFNFPTTTMSEAEMPCSLDLPSGGTFDISVRLTVRNGSASHTSAPKTVVLQKVNTPC